MTTEQNTQDTTAATATPARVSVSVPLQTPIVRRTETIKSIQLMKPRTADLRGLLLSEVLQMKADAVATLLPRISTPTILKHEVDELDPADLVALIDAAIESNPENVDLWFGRGRIFFALKQYDESIASFQKVVELKPELFEGNYYLGVFYTIKADEMNKVMNEKQYSSQAAYDADLKAANAVYMEAIPWFEKAHELKADDFNTLDMLKQLCFRLRDEPGMMEKYEKYNELYKQM